MRQKRSKQLKRIIESQFGAENTSPKAIDSVYKRIKRAWNRTPQNQREQFGQWLSDANNLYRAINNK